MGSSFYRSFEERHRGSVEEIKRRLSFYLPFLAGLKDIYPDGVIADIGCGRGEWLEILTENGIANIGVDLDDGMLARAREAGLNVQKMDCLQFLQSQADQSLIALTGFHIAEHLPFEVLQQLVMHTLRMLTNHLPSTITYSKAKKPITVLHCRKKRFFNLRMQPLIWSMYSKG